MFKIAENWETTYSHRLQNIINLKYDNDSTILDNYDQITIIGIDD